MLKNKLYFIFLFIAVGLIACGNEEKSNLSDQSEPVKVQVEVVKLAALGGEVSYSGSVEPIKKVQLSTKIMGWIEEVPFAEGQQFAKGDLLLKLGSNDLDAKQAQAQAAVNEAIIYFENAQTNLNRIEALFKENAAPQKELDDMRSNFSSAKARKISAEKIKTEVDELLRYSSIRAPFNGTIVRKIMQVGDMANPGQPVIEIQNAAKVKIIAKVPETDIHTLQAGSQVFIKIDAVPDLSNGASPRGEITRVVPAADPMSRQFEIQVELDNSDGKIKPGMFAKISVSKSGREGLLVPKNSIIQRGQLHGVFVVISENYALLRWIRIGGQWQNEVEVLAGLSAGDRVIIQPSKTILDGQVVEVVQ